MHIIYIISISPQAVWTFKSIVWVNTSLFYEIRTQSVNPKSEKF